MPQSLQMHQRAHAAVMIITRDGLHGAQSPSVHEVSAFKMQDRTAYILMFMLVSLIEKGFNNSKLLLGKYICPYGQ